MVSEAGEGVVGGGGEVGLGRRSRSKAVGADFD